jgi:hypothetical protein
MNSPSTTSETIPRSRKKSTIMKGRSWVATVMCGNNVAPLKPVVITGALERWPAPNKWTFDFFRDHYGDLPLEVDGRHLSMAQLIAEVGTSTPSAAPYLRNYPVKGLPGALQADIAPMPSCTAPNWLHNPLITTRASLTCSISAAQAPSRGSTIPTSSSLASGLPGSRPISHRLIEEPRRGSL